MKNCIWLAAVVGSGGGDDTGNRATSSDIARDVLYMPNSLNINSGDVWYSPGVEQERYLAGRAHQW